ncbi:hypothetical protein [Virgisporangium ochraceum]|uniref:Uncharacterized protein n=1 Tax=Virgisporangium ochraceum TaxID=65505 RepID=A0A8J3ZZZ6_9ACTN|nr:hypothetical protein [Virgisporangium ochraceum]GIJ71625.1 hypothetical protein Voc01_065420 [Virgisporangium ochraceum]
MTDAPGGVRAVADAVLYEGYLLYPYRSTATKNQVRWQFGVLGPPGAAEAGVGEEPGLSVQCLLDPADGPGSELTVHLRFLHLQRRDVERVDPAGGYVPVTDLTVAGRTWLTWDEAAEREVALGPTASTPGSHREHRVEVAGGEDVEILRDPHGRTVGRLVRRRRPLSALVTVSTRPAGQGLLRLEVDVRNVTACALDGRDDATAASLLGAHLILVADGATFLSQTDPPDRAREAAAACVQHRCWPVLAGGAVLASPIILYDHPEVAPESAGGLFDSTEIDEILTLRVMTLTDGEKAAARATDPHAAAIIDRCDRLTPADLQRLHGTLRDPRAGGGGPRPAAPIGGGPSWSGPAAPGADSGVPWWDPAADASVDPATDRVVVDGVEIGRDSLVRLRPSRRADAQDLFYAGRVARVTAVLGDVDGGWHVAVVLVDDPAADLHEWYGRYLYFAPDEVEPWKEGRSCEPSEP